MRLFHSINLKLLSTFIVILAAVQTIIAQNNTSPISSDTPASTSNEPWKLLFAALLGLTSFAVLLIVCGCATEFSCAHRCSDDDQRRYEPV